MCRTRKVKRLKRLFGIKKARRAKRGGLTRAELRKKNNREYLEKLRRSEEQIARGEVITVTMEQLRFLEKLDFSHVYPKIV
ncbi:MAG: hypothetical protein IJP56_07600 [Synergistaceae bacterium]|nr:hypothetical protein [Synergistaceae bacterium]MBR0044686.1 hypothetical protein [Synergistaceae bacterium]MBR0221138.1 hypothetical protein [Synergistaceae bacterium]